MNDNSEDLISWLEQHQGQRLSIQKYELDSSSNQVADQDRIRIQLERVSKRNLPFDDPDGYLSPGEVVLHGHGEIMTAGYVQTLPQEAFEIPLRGQVRAYLVEDDTLEVRTLDTIYSIRAT